MKKSVFYTILKICGVFLAAVYLVFVCSAFVDKKGDVVCKQLELVFLDNDEIRLVNAGEVEQLLKKNGLHPAGKAFKSIRTEEIERVLGKNEMIKSAECYLTPSGVSYIHIKQRTPKFRVISNENYYVDTDRKKIKASVNYTAYMPIVSGYVSSSMATGELFDFISYLFENPFWNAQIEQIYVRPDKKIELVPRVGDGIILLGTLDDYEAKFDKLKKLYVRGFNEIGWNRYKTIDLQYKGQVVCTRAF